MARDSCVIYVSCAAVLLAGTILYVYGSTPVRDTTLFDHSPLELNSRARHTRRPPKPTQRAHPDYDIKDPTRVAVPIQPASVSLSSTFTYSRSQTPIFDAPPPSRASEVQTSTPIPFAKNPIEVQAIGGMSFRFRVVVSYLAEARRQKRRLVVYWLYHEMLPAEFGSIFDTSALPSDLTVLTSLPSDRKINATYIPHTIGSKEWVPVLKVFKPASSVQLRIDELLRTLGWPKKSFSAGMLRISVLPTIFLCFLCSTPTCMLFRSSSHAPHG